MSFLSNALSKIATAWGESSTSDDTSVDEQETVPRSALEAAVADAAATMYRVHSAEVVGPDRVAVTFYSQSRKQTWTSYVDFDLEAETFSYTTSYGSVMPAVFARDVLSRL
jgi:hypothetical protein